MTFDGCGMCVRLLEGYVLGQAQVHLDGDDVAYAACVEVVDVGGEGVLVYDVDDLLLCFLGEAFFEEFA